MKNKIRCITCLLLLVSLVGCEALARKFTRKPKQEIAPQSEMVLAPEEYQRPAVSREEEYRQYFLFWKTWQDELIESFSSTTNQKKYLSCLDEAVKNLVQMRPFLKPEMQNRLDACLLRLGQLRAAVANDVYGRNTDANRSEAEAIKRNILRDFSFPRVKDFLQ